jgi:hypothetical protein
VVSLLAVESEYEFVLAQGPLRTAISLVNLGNGRALRAVSPPFLNDRLRQFFLKDKIL